MKGYDAVVDSMLQLFALVKTASQHSDRGEVAAAAAVGGGVVAAAAALPDAVRMQNAHSVPLALELEVLCLL